MAVLERKLIDARQSGKESHGGGERRRIVSRPPFSAQNAGAIILYREGGKIANEGWRDCVDGYSQKYTVKAGDCLKPLAGLSIEPEEAPVEMFGVVSLQTINAL
jgi:hypothetical protein